MGVDGLGGGFKMGFKPAVEGGVLKAEGVVFDMYWVRWGVDKEGCESVVVVGVGGEVTVVTIDVMGSKLSSFTSRPCHKLPVGKGSKDGDVSHASSCVVAVMRATHGGETMVGARRCVTVKAPRDVTQFCVKALTFCDFSLGKVAPRLE